MPHHSDDLGHPVDLPARVGRVVSLVPSLTEAISHSAPEILVGCTAYCTHPPELEAERLRGTKNPHVRRIVEIAPDLVVANMEENRERHVVQLRDAGLPVWVTNIRSVPDALTSLRRMFTAALGLPVPQWLDNAADAWQRPAVVGGPRVAVPIWRNPWMVLGSDTFAGDVLARLGARNVFADHGERYPKLELADITATAPDLVLLPDEPYRFSPTDGPEAFGDLDTALVQGRYLTWYGPSLLEAHAYLGGALSR